MAERGEEARGEVTADANVDDTAEAELPREVEDPAPVRDVEAPAPLMASENPLAPIHLFGMSRIRDSPKTKGLLAKLRAQEVSEPNADTVHQEEVARVRRSLGLVSQIHMANAPAVRDNPEAWKAIMEEMTQFRDTGTLKPDELFEKQSLIHPGEDILFVNLMMLVGIKNVEDAARKKWKARGVALGNNLRNRYGSVIREQLVHAVPAGMEPFRLGFGRPLLTRSRGKRGDARGAYLQAMLSGKKVYITIDEKLLPPGWSKGHNMSSPVRRVYNSMYGLQRGDTDWGRHARSCLVNELNAVWITDFGEESLYMTRSPGQKNAALVKVYSDDFEAVGPEEDKVFDFLSKRLRFGRDASEAESNIKEIIGLERAELPPENGLQRITLHRSKYARHIVSEYEKIHNGGRRLNSIFTPLPHQEKNKYEARKEPEKYPFATEGFDPENPDADLDRDEDISASIPCLFGVKEYLCGETGRLVRGSRPDLAVLYRRLATRFVRWTRKEDYILHRGFQYITKTTNIGLTFTAHVDDLEYLIVNQGSDADHGDDLYDTKSTSGRLVKLKGPRGTNIPIAWFARKQGATTRNTAHAELGGLDETTFKFGLPLTGIMETILNRTVRLIAEADATAALGAVRRGYPRKLAYLKKVQKVSIPALHEVFYGNSPELIPDDAWTYNRLTHRDSERNDADLLTKSFSVERHWALCEMIGLRPVPS